MGNARLAAIGFLIGAGGMMSADNFLHHAPDHSFTILVGLLAAAIAVAVGGK
jgi:hypothetical protein